MTAQSPQIADQGPPKTPLILYLLAFVVVGAVWIAYDTLTSRTGEDLTTWTETTLNREQIVAGLKSTEDPSACHALVQLSRILRTESLAPLGEDEVLAALETLVERDHVMLQSLAGMALSLMPRAKPDRASTILLQLLAKDDAKVKLNAAIGLAARGRDEGADFLAETLSNTRSDQGEVRRDLLRSLRHVAQERHLAVIKRQEQLAELDGDKIAREFCREARARIEKN